MFSYTEGMRVDLAAQCFFNGLLKEFTGWTQDAELKQISMALPNSGQILLLSYAHFSVCGPHKFIFPIRYRQLEGRDLQEGELTFQQALKLILDEEAILGSVSASARHLFYERVMQSAANTASAISLRAADLAHLYSGKLNFIEAEQALLAGHNMHPAPKSRSEFSGEDIRYAPESGQSFGLHWFAVHHSAWQGDVYQSDVQETIGAIIEDLGLEFDPLPQGFQLLPMHPWQVPVLREREDIAELFAADLIIDLGNRGEGWRATTSLRAVYHPDCRFMIKYSLSVKLTNSVRHLSVKEVRRGILLEQILDADKGQEFQQRYPDMTIIREPGFAVLQGKTCGAIEESLLAFRVNSFWQQSERESLVLATLTQADPRGEDSLLAHMVRRRAQERQLSNSKAAQQWFQGYLNQILEPLIVARSDYGLIFLAHQQNIVVDIRDQLPVGMFYRDCQGTGFTCAAQECFPEQLGEQTPENFMPHQFVDPYISYYLIFNSTFSVISALASAGLVAEEVLLNQLRLFMGIQQQKGYKDPGLIDYLLNSESLIFKGNFFVYLSNINENSIEDPSEIYRTIPNPIYRQSDVPTLVKRLPDESLMAFSQHQTLRVETPDLALEVHVSECDGVRLLQPLSPSLDSDNPPLRLTYVQMLSLLEHGLFSSQVNGVSLSISHWHQLCHMAPPPWMFVDEQVLFIGVSQFEQNPDLWLVSPLQSSPAAVVNSADVSHPRRPRHASGVFYRRYNYELGLELSLRMADPDKDLSLFHHWMNQERVSEFWELDKPKAELKEYLQQTLARKHQFPVFAMIDGITFGYFELYWAKEDRLGPYYDAEDYDRGIHLLIGDARFLGSQYWKVWGNYLIQYCFLSECRTERLVGEPRIDNKRLIKLWQYFGYDKVKDFHFPHKHAALVMARREDFFKQMTMHYQEQKI